MAIHLLLALAAAGNTAHILDVALASVFGNGNSPFYLRVARSNNGRSMGYLSWVTWDGAKCLTESMNRGKICLRSS
jgi:hypothetical protein